MQAHKGFLPKYGHKHLPGPPDRNLVKTQVGLGALMPVHTSSMAMQSIVYRPLVRCVLVACTHISCVCAGAAIWHSVAAQLTPFPQVPSLTQERWRPQVIVSSQADRSTEAAWQAAAWRVGRMDGRRMHALCVIARPVLLVIVTPGNVGLIALNPDMLLLNLVYYSIHVHLAAANATEDLTAPVQWPSSLQHEATVIEQLIDAQVARSLASSAMMLRVARSIASAFNHQLLQMHKPSSISDACLLSSHGCATGVAVEGHITHWCHLQS